MAEPGKDLGSIRFDSFDLSIETGELRKNGVRLKLSGQPIQVLLLLAACPGELITREELQKKLWPGASFGDFEHGLNAAVNRLRETLGDSTAEPKYIETVPRRGYRFIALQSAAPSAKVEIEPPKPEPKPPKPRRWKRMAAIAVAVVVIVGFFYPLIAPRVENLARLLELQRLKVVPLTALPGMVTSPTFSPDGSQVAFGWDGGSMTTGFDLYVKTIGSDAPVRLTHHPAGILFAAWSPDGRGIATLRTGTEGSGIYLVSPTGGPERQLVSGGVGIQILDSNNLTWSPDGKYLAFVSIPSGPPGSLSLFMLPLDTLQPTFVKTGCGSGSVWSPSFSPRGTYLAWVCRDVGSGSSSLHLLRRGDGNHTQILKQTQGIDSIAWSGDERRIVFSSLGDLWEVSLARPGRAERLPVGHDVLLLTANLAAHRLAYVQMRMNVNIWRLDLHGSPPQTRELVTSSRRQLAPSISPDGRRIAFDSDRTGGNEIWVCDADGSNALQLSFFGIQETGTPRWSPDGKLIAFDSRIGGSGDESNIYVVDPNGGAPRKLDIDVGKNSVPSWSRDGRWIYFSHGPASDLSIWKVPSEGGHATQVVQSPAFPHMESPDGQYLYFVRKQRLWRIETSGSAEEEVKGMPKFNPAGFNGGWFAAQAGIYYVAYGAADASKQEIDFFDLGTKQTRRVFEFEKITPPGWMGGMPVSSDGEWLLFPQVDERSSDLMMVDNWR
jgi:Tol biopolymer transport system component/DNA-binding winged helix-turn-helix (wHTH) protein